MYLASIFSWVLFVIKIYSIPTKGWTTRNENGVYGIWNNGFYYYFYSRWHRIHLINSIFIPASHILILNSYKSIKWTGTHRRKMAMAPEEISHYLDCRQRACLIYERIYLIPLWIKFRNHIGYPFIQYDSLTEAVRF